MTTKLTEASLSLEKHVSHFLSENLLLFANTQKQGSAKLFRKLFRIFPEILSSLGTFWNVIPMWERIKNQHFSTSNYFSSWIQVKKLLFDDFKMQSNKNCAYFFNTLCKTILLQSQKYLLLGAIFILTDFVYI